MRAFPSGVVSRSEALAAGWSDPALARAVRAGRITRLRAGYFSADPRPEHFAIAAARRCRGSALSHRTGAALQKIPLLCPDPDLPDLSVQPEDRGALRGANLHRARFDADELVFVAGVAVLNPARTAVDLARQSGVMAGIIAMDHVLNHRLATESAISTVLERCWNWPGIRRAGRAFLLSDSRAESPLESLSRIALNLMALPRAVPQQILRDERGLVVARTDFGWADFGVVGEADGMSKYASRDVLRAEKARQETLEQLGLVVVRWNWDEITRRPRQVEARLLDGFRRAEALRRSGSPRYWSV